MSTVYQDKRGWLFTVRQGLSPMFKGFYNKNANAKGTASPGWHGVRTLQYRNRQKDAENDLAEYAKKHDMKIFEMW